MSGETRLSNMTAHVQDVVIIGGGISGAAACYELARAGVSVMLVEKGSLASMASGLSLGGVRQSGRAAAELPLAQAAIRRWENLANELEADIEYRQEGNLRLARTPEEVETVAHTVEAQRALGLDLTFLPDNAAVREVAPALSEAVLAASYCPTDGHANPTATVRAFAAAAERHGATIRSHTTATGIDVRNGRVIGLRTNAGSIATDVVVIAAGVYSDHLCRMVGLELPLTITPASIVQTTPLRPILQQVLGTASADFSGRQEVGGRLLMNARVGPWQGLPNEAQLAARVIATISDRVTEVLPAFGQAKIDRVWSGLLDITPDGLPVIERTSEVDGLIIAAGFSGHGFCLGPMTGQFICELVTEKQPSLPLQPFRRGRFVDMTGSQETEHESSQRDRGG